jgi:hypothetical protein
LAREGVDLDGDAFGIIFWVGLDPVLRELLVWSFRMPAAPAFGSL